MSSTGESREGRRLLVVDFNNLIWRSLALHGQLSYGDTFTGGLFGFIAQMSRYMSDVEPSHVAVCQDSPPYLRKQEFAGYKGDRKKERDEDVYRRFVESCALCREFISVMGFAHLEAPGYEADDFAAALAIRYRNRFARIVIASNDSDLHQLFWIRNLVLHRGTKRGLYTLEDFQKEWPGIDCEQWIEMLALTGTHNAVPGIRKVGPVTAYKAVRFGDRLEELRREHGQVIDRNRRLIRLPYVGLPKGAYMLTTTQPAAERELLRFLARYAIQLQPWMKTPFDAYREVER